MCPETPLPYVAIHYVALCEMALHCHTLHWVLKLLGFSGIAGSAQAGRKPAHGARMDASRPSGPAWARPEGKPAHGARMPARYGALIFP